MCDVPGCFQCVLEQAGDRHGTDATGYGRDGAGMDRDLVEGYVADDCWSGWCRDAVDADIYDDGSRLDPASAYEAGMTCRDDQDVCPACFGSNIARLQMRENDRAPFVEKEARHRASDDVRTAYDDCMETGEHRQNAPQQDQATKRRAGNHAIRSSDRQFSCIDDMKSINVFFRRDGVEHGISLNVRRQRKLDEDAVNILIIIQRSYQIQQRGLWRIGRQAMAEGPHSYGLGLADLATYIDCTGGIVADQNDGQAGRDALLSQERDVLSHRVRERFGFCRAVDERCTLRHIDVQH